MKKKSSAREQTSASKRVFKQLSNVEHVRLRTGMWLGQNSLANYQQHFFVPVSSSKQKNRSLAAVPQGTKKNSSHSHKATYQITSEEVTDIPAKLKCLDEVCMNAVDEYNRNRLDKTLRPNKKMDELRVTLHANGSRVTVEDNGRGIPYKNAEHVFLHLMYGENFDDAARTEHVAGQNGVGVSLVRIVSKYFYAETCHDNVLYQKLFTIDEVFLKVLKGVSLSTQLETLFIKTIEEQGTFEKLEAFKKLPALIQKELKMAFKKTGMEKRLTPIAPKTLPATSNLLRRGTRITFELNEAYFNKLAVTFSSRLLRQYLSDIAMTNPPLRVIFTDRTSNETHTFVYKRGLEDVLTQTNLDYYKLSHQEKDLGFNLESFIVLGEGRTLSWVNGNFASLGGSAIDYFENRLCDEVRKKPSLMQAEKRLKITITRNDVRKLFHVYHVLNVIAPRFKSQDKSYLINDLNAPIRRAVDTNLERLIKKINLLSHIISECERRAQFRDFTDATKEVKRVSRTYIEKLIPCSSKTSPAERVLFLGEGDSAIAGLRSVRNPLCHALFPLRGKPLNVKDLSLARVLQNKEFKNIVAILGLPLEGKITALSQLNYPRICIVTDADYDGYAIRSLILNFFFEYWKELFSLGAIYLVEAPLYEVDLVNPRKEKKRFYCINDHQFTVLMKKAKAENCSLVRKKRNKGLGETSAAAMTYAINHNLLPIRLSDIKKSRRIQKLWFAKDEAANRRQQIASYAQLFFSE